ncbi:MAG: alpha/beta hydrolase [Phycisphaerae bacterium]
MIWPFLTLGLLLLAVGGVGAAVVVFGMARTLIRPPRMTDAKAMRILGRLTPDDLHLPWENWPVEVPDAAAAGKRLKLTNWWLPHPHAAGRCVVLVHGFGDAKVGALAWAPLWHAMGFNILATDLRAHGESGGKYSTGGFLERHDLNHLLDELLAQKPDDCRTLVLFGVSLGAATSLAAACERDDLAGVVLDSPFADYRRAILAHGRMRGLPFLALQPAAARLSEWLAEADFAVVAPRDLIGEVPCPALLAYGGEDAFVSPEDRAELRDALARRDRAEDGAFEMPDAGHVLGLAADPAGYATELAAFLARCGVAVRHDDSPAAATPEA